MNRAAGSPFAITAMTAVSALGLDAATACAAARAGLTRASALTHFPMTSMTTGEPEWPMGHAVPLITQGFEGELRLQRMFLHSLREEKIRECLTSAARIGWFWAMPPARVTDSHEHASHMAALAQRLHAHAKDKLVLPSVGSIYCVDCSGAVGVAKLMAQVMRALAQDELDLAIICAVDSLLDANIVRQLHEQHRLKCDAQPVGFQPGEGCVILVAEHPGRAVTRKASVAGMVTAISMESTADAEADPLFVSGKNLSKVVTDLCRLNGIAHSPWVLCDHNGESHRAMAWGHAMAQVAHHHPPLADMHFDYLVGSFGDCGAVNAALHSVYAMTAFARGYARADTALVVATGDTHERAGFSVTSQ
jgi:3-oxoacyl-[acyl-carrier-protein] synthase I